MELDFSNDVIEKLLLKRALQEKHWLSILANVYESLFSKSRFKEKKSLFKDKNVSLIVKLAMKYFSKYNQTPNSKVIQLLAKKYADVHDMEGIDLSQVNETLMEVQNMNFNIDESILKKNLKDFILQQAMVETLSENAEILTSGDGNYQKVVDQCLENFDKVQKITFNDADLGMNYFDEKDMKDHWDFIRNPEAKIKTGWDALDSYTNGGFLRDGRMLALFMAQAGLGKSVFMSNVAVNFLKQNLGVVVVSLEMSQDVYAQRFDAHISKKNINQLRDNEETATARIKEFYQKYPKANLFIKEYPPRSIRTNDIEQYLDNLKNAGHKFDVIIVDYLNLVLPNHGTDSMYKDGLSVSEELRALSYKFNVPVISAVQANSEGMNSETIDMQNISESRGIAHTSDFIGALFQSQNAKEEGIIQMRLVKNRLGGQIGKICRFKMDPETLTVADITFDNSFEIAENESSAIGNIIKNYAGISSDINNI